MFDFPKLALVRSNRFQPFPMFVCLLDFSPLGFFSFLFKTKFFLPLLVQVILPLPLVLLPLPLPLLLLLMLLPLLP